MLVRSDSSANSGHASHCQSASQPQPQRQMHFRPSAFSVSTVAKQSVRFSSRSSQDAFYDRPVGWSVCPRAQDEKILDSPSAIETRYQSVGAYCLLPYVLPTANQSTSPQGLLSSARERARAVCGVSGGLQKKITREERTSPTTLCGAIRVQCVSVVVVVRVPKD